jgi:hypothetical protein
MLNNAVMKSLLFFCVGVIVYTTGVRNMNELGGLGKKMPIVAACYLVAALAISDATGTVVSYVPQRDASGLLVWTTDPGGVANLNGGRLPVFARVDVRATFKPSWSHNRWQLYAEVINALNRKNAGNLDSKLEYDAGSDKPRLVQSPNAALPFLPSFGIRFRF